MNVAINSKMLVTTPPPFCVGASPDRGTNFKRVGMGMCFPLKPSVNPLELSCFTA